ncbi:DUF4194 domain-containing protein [Lonepinella sp. MS14437]|uniref:DUF4194 domain-containing protein n=1 Tax=Lonepinella sp. MS14437 TaxID=3003620 RepID=UPI0036DE3A93
MSQSLFEMISGKPTDTTSELEPVENSESQDEVSPPEVFPQAMPEDAKRVLVYLLRQGVILHSQKAKLFESLCRYQVQIRQHLADVYLSLMLDERAGVAFVQTQDSTASDDEADEADEDSYSLITRRTLSLFDTLLLLVLRKHYQERETAGEQKIIIDLEQLEISLSPFLPLVEHASLERKKLSGRVKELMKRKLLTAVRGSDERFEITPIIRYVVNAEFLESLLVEYQQLAEQ